MNSYQFTINKKISTIKVGENKFKFAIDKSGATTINITQDKIEDVIYSVFDNSEYLDLVRIITNIKGTQQVPKNFLARHWWSGKRACRLARLRVRRHNRFGFNRRSHICN